MKKIITAILLTSAVFASGSEDINKKLDLLLQKIEQLEKKVDAKDSEIRKLKQQLQKQQKEIKTNTKEVKEEFKQQLAIKSCKELKVTSFGYTYHDDIMPYYDLSVTLKNNYPKKIVFVEGNLYAEDADGVKILEDFIKRKIKISAGKSIQINKTHQVNSDLEMYLKDEKPGNLRVYFEVIKAKFSDGSVLDCSDL